MSLIFRFFSLQGGCDGFKWPSPNIILRQKRNNVIVMGKKLLHVLVLCAVVFSVLPMGVNVALPPINSGEIGDDINVGEEKREDDWGQDAPSMAAEQPPLVESYFNYTDYNVGSQISTRTGDMIKIDNYLYSISLCLNPANKFDLVKRNLDGSAIWNKTVGYNAYGFVFIDNIFYVYGNSAGDIVLIKMDLNGNVLDTHFLVLDFGQFVFSGDTDGTDIYLTYYNHTSESSPDHIGVMRITTDYQIQWADTWNIHIESYTDCPQKIRYYQDHVYICGQSNKSAVLLKYHKDGAFVWVQQFQLVNSNFVNMNFKENLIYIMGQDIGSLF